MDNILTDISLMKDNISEIMSLSEKSQIPLGLRRIARDTYMYYLSRGSS